MSPHPSSKAILWRDRLFILSGLAILTLLAWGYMMVTAGGMSNMPMASGVHAWGISDFFFAFGMWSVMMAGMMLPSASPMILTFSGINRRREVGHPLLYTILFVGGYLLVWVGYSAAGALLQGAFQTASLITMMLMFVLGVMNLLWMAALTAFFLIEKVAPAGDRVGRVAGVLFTVWGAWLIVDLLF